MDNDTIVAISSPLGNSLRGIIRLSGKNAFQLVQDTVNQPLITKNWQTVYCSLNIKPTFLSESNTKWRIPVTLYLMHAPRSYTREDVAEIHTFGTKALLENIVEYFISKGATLATPGEFTKRAFLNGRINLSQAEAVLNIIHSSSEREHHLAVCKLYEHSSIYLREIRDQLIELISRIEISLDFSDQDIEIISYHQIKNVTNSISARIREVLRGMSASKSLSADGIICVLCGKTNVGKSSLFNRLVEDRQNIVSPIPGTTRDYIEGIFSYPNIRVETGQEMVFRLFDTAGSYGFTDEISRQAQKRTGEILKQADIYLMVIDGSQKPDAQDRAIYKRLENDKTIVVINKIDLMSVSQLDGQLAHWSTGQPVGVSAYTGKGIASLNKTLWELSASKPPERSSNELIINMRQRENLSLCLKSLNKAKAGGNKKLSYEFIVLDLRQALDSINFALDGYVSGKSLITDDILNNIFSRFCIGK